VKDKDADPTEPPDLSTPNANLAMNGALELAMVPSKIRAQVAPNEAMATVERNMFGPNPISRYVFQTKRSGVKGTPIGRREVVFCHGGL
jgi:hypothetical protein